MRDALVTCPCGSRVPFKRTELLTMVANPGQKGGQKFQVRYCPSCMMKVKARARKLADQQAKEQKEAADRQRAVSREIRGL